MSCQVAGSAVGRRPCGLAVLACLASAVLERYPSGRNDLVGDHSPSPVEDRHHRRQTDDIDSLNPFTGIESSAYEIYQLQLRDVDRLRAGRLQHPAGTGRELGRLPDGLTWTYHLRAGLKWSDGQPLTAKDVAYTFNRVRNGKYEQTNYGNYVSGLTSVVATDDHRRHEGQEADSDHGAPLHLHPPEHIWKRSTRRGQVLPTTPARTASSEPARSS
jgi:hypothetical protein